MTEQEVRQFAELCQKTDHNQMVLCGDGAVGIGMN